MENIMNKNEMNIGMKFSGKACNENSEIPTKAQTVRDSATGAGEAPRGSGTEQKTTIRPTKNADKAINAKDVCESTEPKTSGKRRAAKNSIAPGFFTKELTISEEDRPEFEALRDRLTQEYAPTTAMRQTVLDLITYFSWRLRLELRNEEGSHGEQQVDAAGGTNNLVGWYAADHRSLKNGLRFLLDLREIIVHLGIEHLEHDQPLKDQLIRGFGIGFYNCLTEWKHMSVGTIQLAEHLEYMMLTYNMQLPSDDFLGESAAYWRARRETAGLKSPPMDTRLENLDNNRQPPKVIVDPGLVRQMALKLIDVQMEFLETLIRIRRRRSEEAPHALSQSSTRRSEDAYRCLQRAIELFLKVVEHGL
jgi:hypothetical protein